MMKATKFIFIALAAFAASALTSCGSKTVISGTWEGGQGDTLVLCEKVPEADSIFIASAVVGEDGSFSFAVAPEYPKRLTLWFGGKSKDIFVGKDPIGVTITKREGTNRKGEAYSTFDCAVDGGRDQKILEDGAEFTLSNAFIQLGTMIMASKLSEMTDEKQIDSISRGIVMMKEAYDSVIRVYLDTTRNSVAVTYFFNDFLLKSRPFEFARDWYDSLDASVKGSVQAATSPRRSRWRPSSAWAENLMTSRFLTRTERISPSASSAVTTRSLTSGLPGAAVPCGSTEREGHLREASQGRT